MSDSPLPLTNMEQDHIQTVDNNNNNNSTNKLNKVDFTQTNGENITTEEAEEKHDALSEQRSVSDSDLDSCDDFSVDDLEDKAIDDDVTADVVHSDKETIQRTSEDSSTNRRLSQYGHAQARREEERNVLADEEILASLNDANKPRQEEESDEFRQNSKDDNPLGTDLHSFSRPSGLIGTKYKTDADNFEYPQLSEENMLEKLADTDVTGHSAVIDRLKDINVTNLSKLHNMDRSDPAVKRLLVRPRVTSKEVKNINIDADIKAMVSEFLKTNITGNFIITRVLRENYATFYSWLATHLQVERNAWAARLKQALEKMEQERKDNIETNDLIKESAVRLRHLVQSCSTNMFGLPCKTDMSNTHKNIQTKQSNSAADGCNNQRTVGHENNRSKVAPSETDSAYQARKQSFHQRLNTLGRLNERPGGGSSRLTQSSFNLVQVPSASKTAVNYESDPGIYSSSRDFYRGGSLTAPKGQSSTSRSTARTKDSLSKTSDNDIEDHSYFSGNEIISAVGVEDDGVTDWRQVIRDSLDVLTDICDTLINDRTGCLRLMGVKPHHCSSLVDVLSTYTQDRHTSGNSKRKEIEKRLGLLEIENRTLVEEITTMQTTLRDKNNDALSLQKQLDRLEALVNSNTSPKMDKCVGTEDSVVKIIQRAGGNKTSKSPFGLMQLGKSPLGYAKASRSPHLNDKVTQEINGIHIIMPQRKKPGQDGKLPKANQNSNDVSQAEANDSQIEQNKVSHLTVPAIQPHQPSRERSLIEISEEKLKTLKLRARKLEDSLHDAISSMVRLNKLAPPDDNASVISAISASTVASILSKSSKNNHQNRQKQKFWKKPSSQVDGSLAVHIIPDSLAANTTVPIINRNILPGTKEQTELDSLRIPLESEKSSLLSGRSMVLSSHVMSDRTPIPSSLRVSGDRMARAKSMSSRSHTNHSLSSDHGSGQANETDNAKEDDNDSDEGNLTSSISTKPLPFASLPIKKKPKVISRPRQTGKGVVSKCLRCHKLFNSVDNHKLACCYHTKDKERMEHYDPSGRLIKVMYAWKCCLQPQENEGCCYGQHV